MAYCRWSTPDCDVYVYEDVMGGWTTHVKGPSGVRTFRDPTPGDCGRTLTVLVREGLKVPPYVFRDLEAEQQDFDNTQKESAYP